MYNGGMAMKMSKRIISVLLALVLLSGCAVIALAECAHKYEENFVPPTCNERGYTEYVCPDCEYSYVEEFLDPIPHTYKKEVTENLDYGNYNCHYRRDVALLGILLRYGDRLLGA